MKDEPAKSGPKQGWSSLFIPKYKGANVVKVQTKTWSNVSANVKELQIAGQFHVDLKHDCARLAVILAVTGDIPDARGSPSRPTALVDYTKHQMNYTPAGVPVWAHSEDTQFLRHITFLFSPEMLLNPVDEDDLCLGAAEPHFMFHDQRIMHLATLFQIECETEECTDILYGDSLAVALLSRLAKLAGRDKQQNRTYTLSAQQFHRLRTYILDRLSHQNSLAELASVVGMSRSSFGRAFKSSVGVSPHRWLLQQRVERAKEHLAAGLLPLAEIAQVTGFVDQAHFSRMFRCLEGISPGAWRRSQRH